MKSTMKFPETYLHVRDNNTGKEWICPIGDETPLDLRKLVLQWAGDTFSGELTLDEKLMPKLDGDFYARIMTDGRPPSSVFCWTGGGFYLKATY